MGTWLSLVESYWYVKRLRVHVVLELSVAITLETKSRELEGGTCSQSFIKWY